MSYTPSDFRQNPITSAISWRTITDESHQVGELNFLPGIYGFVLKDRPNPDTNTIQFITDDTSAVEYEIVTSGTPLPGQVRYDSTRGICIFNPANNGTEFLVSYQGAGTNLTYEMLSSIATYGPDVEQLQADVAQIFSDLYELTQKVDQAESDIAGLDGRVDDLETFEGNFQALVEIYSKRIGEPFAVFNNIAGVPEPPSSNFIKLTKGLTGSGQYNEGKLTSQSVVTSGNVRYYTAVISDSGSPIDGQTIPLINSTEISNTAGTWVNLPAVVGALETAGQFFANQVQGHWHRVGYDNASGSGATGTVSGSSYRTPPITPSYRYLSQLAEEIYRDGVNGTPRVGTQTRQDTFSAVYYMRYK